MHFVMLVSIAASRFDLKITYYEIWPMYETKVSSVNLRYDQTYLDLNRISSGVFYVTFEGLIPQHPLNF